MRILRQSPGYSLAQSAGFSLIEILLAIGALAIISLAGAQVAMNLIGSVNTVEFRQGVESATEEFSAFLESQAICEANFKDSSFDPTGQIEVATLKDSTLVDKYLTGAPLPGTKLLIHRFILQEFKPFEPAVIANTRGVAQFSIIYASGTQALGLTQVRRNVNTYVNVKSRNPASPDYLKIETCSARKLSLSDFGAAQATFNVTTGFAPVLNSGSNIASINALGAGRYRLNFTTPLPDNKYVVVVTVGDVPGDCCIANIFNPAVTKTADRFVFQVKTSGKDNDPTNAAIEVSGAVFATPP